MNLKSEFDVLKEINEIRTQLSFSKRMSFFLGAGTSMALGIPGIVGLTNQVYEQLQNDQKDAYKKVREDLATESSAEPTIEHILNQLRLIREITREKPSKSYSGITGEDAKNLDVAICNQIYSVLSKKEGEITSLGEGIRGNIGNKTNPSADSVEHETNNLEVIEKFLSWYSLTVVDYEKEIFGI